MWIRTNDGSMENIDLSKYPQTKDKMMVLIRKITNRMLYDYDTQQQNTRANLIWLIKENDLK